MSNTPTQESSAASASDVEKQTALFVQLVLQQSNLASMLLGQTPHPETGQTIRDLNAARLFIDQLEMLEAKTRNNLTPLETNLLKQTLMSLRLAFVEAINAPASTPTPPVDQLAEAPPPAAPVPPGEDESKKRFSKKFDL